MTAFEPAYLKLLQSGELQDRVTQAYENLEACNLCAWECGVNRRQGKRGVCRTGERAAVSSFGAHHGRRKPTAGVARIGDDLLYPVQPALPILPEP